jgi:sec-independent protein translocase protein TatB
MFGMGMGELLLILVVALLVVGPDKLPQAAKAIGKGIRDFRRHSQELQSTLEQDEKLGEAVRELRSALRDDPLRPLRTPFSSTPPPRPPTPALDPAATPAVDPAATASTTAAAASTASAAAASTAPASEPQPPTIVPAAGAVAKQPEPRPVAATIPRAKPDDPAHG